MAPSFDPYSQWLGIADPKRPVDHYRLLGVERLESDPRALFAAVDRRMATLRKVRAGQHAAELQRVRHEIIVAKGCLLNPKKKAAYDARLGAGGGSTSPPGESKTPPPLTPTMPAAQIVELERAPSTVVEDEPPQRNYQSLVLGVITAVILVGTGIMVVVATHRPEPKAVELAGADLEIEPDAPGDEETKPATPSGQLPKPSPEPSEPRPTEPKPSTPGADPRPDDTATPPPVAPPTNPAPPVSVPEGEPSEPVARLHVEGALQRVRAALSMRRIATADEFLTWAEVRAEPGQRSEIQRLRQVLGNVRYFWSMLHMNVATLKTGERLSHGPSIFTVVENAPEGLTVTRMATGQNQRWPTATQFPTELVLAIVETKFDRQRPETKLAHAAFLIFDPQGDRQQASRLLEETEEAGTATVALQAAALRGELPLELVLLPGESLLPPSDLPRIPGEERPGGVVPPINPVGVLPVPGGGRPMGPPAIPQGPTLVGPFAAPAEPKDGRMEGPFIIPAEPEKLIAPSPAALAAAEAHIAATYGTAIRQARLEFQKQKMAQQFLGLADLAKNDPTMRYALLAQAGIMAIDAADPSLVLDSLDTLDAEYRIDRSELLDKAIQGMSDGVGRSLDSRFGLAERLMFLCRMKAGAGDDETAIHLAQGVIDLLPGGARGDAKDLKQEAGRLKFTLETRRENRR